MNVLRREHAAFGDDCRDEFGWCDVEGGIEHVDIEWGGAHLPECRAHFIRMALLDRDVGPALRGEVDG